MANEGFEGAATGLALFRTALVWRLVTFLVAFGYAFLQLASPRAQDSGGFGLVLGVAEIAATVAALVGAAWFASRAPDRAARGAGLAPWCLGVATILQIYELWIATRVLEYKSSASSMIPWHGSLSDLEVEYARLPYLLIGSAVAGLLATLGIIVGIASVARALSRPALVRHAYATGLGLFVFAVLFGVVESSSSRSRFDVVGSGVIAVLGLALLVAFALLLAQAIEAMRSGPATLPVAHVVAGSK